jgi:serpin B
MNRFFSPYSISLCFAMVYAGARSNTENQMTDVFQYTLDQESLHSAFNALGLDLLSREQDSDGDNQEDFKLEIFNSMWAQAGYEFLPTYLDLLAENYDAGIYLVNLRYDSYGSSQVINDWVFEQTEGLIDDLVMPSDFNSESIFVLVNTIYFKAKWLDEFIEEATRDDTFYTPKKEVTVPMMVQSCNVYYSEGENYQAAGIPYKGGDTEMLVLLPKEGSFNQFEASLTPEQVGQIAANGQYREVAVYLPKFECRPEAIDLKDVLSQMGMTDAFVFGSSDFSGIDGSKQIYLQWAKHEAFVKVNEHGTEAAAATAIGGGAGGYGPEIFFIVNRPFIFLIRDRITGTILFMGRILNPLA